ncbi:MAG: flagellar biosynthesis protein FlhA [Verrucomicrobia bacterium]|nr:flagellar biosynthesis protein FlhA [Verrucomicrobiota bacterium]
MNLKKIMSAITQSLKQGDLLMTFGVFGTVMIMVLPIGTFIMDGLLAVSIAMAFLIMLVILYIKEPSDFTGFPTLLLFLTLFRLGLNIASTRLILIDGNAGQIIESFGNFVVRGNYVVGLVIFCILAIINFVVITKGAGRIAEVAARFTLDALPGKQMAIDAELNAGMLSETEAKQKRKKVEQEADFYGAMDGASKFVRGDAVAGVLITLINIVGGIAIGIFQKGLSVTESIERFTLLSIGDGLVSQVPALITSIAAGTLVTRAAASEEIGKELGRQLLNFPKALGVLGVMLGLMAFVPGMPVVPFLTLAAGSAFMARKLVKMRDSQDKSGHTFKAGEKGSPAASGVSGNKHPSGSDNAQDHVSSGAQEKLEPLLQLDPFLFELGFNLVALADKKTGGDLLQRVTGVRKQFAEEMGIIIPPIRLKDNLELQGEEYNFLIKGHVVASGTAYPNRWLAMNATHSTTVLNGIQTSEPVFKLPATWISESDKRHAEISGFTVVDAGSVVITHLTHVLRQNCHQLLSRQSVQNLLDHLKENHGALVSELIPSQLTIGVVHRILQNLLLEGLSIKDLPGILEIVSDYAGITKNPDELSEHARKALGHQIASHLKDSHGVVQVITIDSQLESEMTRSIQQSAMEINLFLDPSVAHHAISSLSRLIQSMVAEGLVPVVMTGPALRLGFRKFFQPTFSELRVISYSEIPNDVDIKSFGTLKKRESSEVGVPG